MAAIKRWTSAWEQTLTFSRERRFHSSKKGSSRSEFDSGDDDENREGWEAKYLRKDGFCKKVERGLLSGKVFSSSVTVCPVGGAGSPDDCVGGTLSLFSCS